jgi:hypothetical protein
MRLFLFAKMSALACIATIATCRASACQCGSNFHGKNSWALAKLEASGTSVIFEGMPERFEVQWNVLNAKEGELISSEDSADKYSHLPGMLVTFRVQRTYKGDLGPEIQIKTGLGGGDCGAVFAPGLTYLVFASGPSVADLGVSMCSPGGWIGSPSVATELRYLRKERPTAGDLIRMKPWTVGEYAAQDVQRQRNFEDFQRRYAIVTGKVCGTLTADRLKDGNSGLLSFLSTTGFSPIEHPTANVNPNGSFCSGPLGPGKYYLYFSRGSDGGMMSAVFYPGVSEKAKATTIEVRAGQTQSNVLFEVPLQKTYSVRGIISTNDKSGLDSRNVYLSLIGLDGGPFLQRYNQLIDFQSPFPFLKTKYFNFENVLPGRYIAYVSVLGHGWYMKKQEMTVTTHSKFIFLQLEHRK